MTDHSVVKTFVNDIRHKCGQRRLGKLRVGIPAHPVMCTVSESLRECGVWEAQPVGDYVVLLSRNRKQQISYENAEVARWMRDYDEGQFPELARPASEIRLKRPGQRKAEVIG